MMAAAAMTPDLRSRALAGVMYQWGMNKVAFESAAVGSTNKLIVLGGLTDGLMPCEWVVPLSHAAHELGWALVQPVLSSSYAGYGTGTLARDAEELSALVTDMVESRGCERVVVCGHSTGCQIACTFARRGTPEAVSRLAAVVLQAPVSDQESGGMEEGTARWLTHARAVASPATELMPMDAHYVPITAERYLSLYETDGLQPDDFFSSYLTDEQLRERLGHLDPKPTLVAFSMADEYVPAHVDKGALAERIARAAGRGAVVLPLEGASHSLAEPRDGAARRQFVRAVADLLAGL